MSLINDEQALADRIAAEVISLMPDPIEIARRANHSMARQLTIVYVSFASTVLVTLFIDQHLPRWPLYTFILVLLLMAGFWNSRADRYRRQGADPYLIKHREHRQAVRIVVMVPIVILSVAAFGMAGYAAALLRAPLTIVFILWAWDLITLMYAQGREAQGLVAREQVAQEFEAQAPERAEEQLSPATSPES